MPDAKMTQKIAIWAP